MCETYIFENVMKNYGVYNVVDCRGISFSLSVVDTKRVEHFTGIYSLLFVE